MIRRICKAELSVSRMWPWPLQRGHGIDAQSMRAFIASLELPADERQRLMEMTPSTYTGAAERLARAI